MKRKNDILPRASFFFNFTIENIKISRIIWTEVSFNARII